jgi:glucosyl-3-phosphoglycerate synthase
MSEYHQDGIITTIHNLHEVFDLEGYLIELEKKLENFSKHLRLSLLLPCLYDEIKRGEVIQNIIDNINQINYVHNIFIALGGAQEKEKFLECKEFFSKLKKKNRGVKIVWIDSPAIQSIFERIAEGKINIGVRGKGQSVWITLGYLFSREDTDVIALHDTDIITYDRMLIGRLFEPTANPNNDFEFCKGYYARISPVEKEMKGRVTRLFVVPFVETLISLMQKRKDTQLENFFRYHRAYRYPLGGEVCFSTKLAKGINVAHNWSLEVSTLSEVYDKVSPRKIAQIDLSKNYEHKHQELSVEDPHKGLHRMVIDITRFFLDYTRSNGHILNTEFIEMLQDTYYKKAQIFIKKYSDDSESNNLNYNRQQEESTVLYFRNFIGDAWKQMLSEETRSQIPSWNRVAFSFPGIYEELKKAVEKDND